MKVEKFWSYVKDTAMQFCYKCRSESKAVNSEGNFRTYIQYVCEYCEYHLDPANMKISMTFFCSILEYLHVENSEILM